MRAHRLRSIPKILLVSIGLICTLHPTCEAAPNAAFPAPYTSVIVQTKSDLDRRQINATIERNSTNAPIITVEELYVPGTRLMVFVTMFLGKEMAYVESMSVIEAAFRDVVKYQNLGQAVGKRWGFCEPATGISSFFSIGPRDNIKDRPLQWGNVANILRPGLRNWTQRRTDEGKKLYEFDFDIRFVGSSMYLADGKMTRYKCRPISS